MEIGSETDGDNAPLGFSPDALDALQAPWTPLSPGELLSRVAHFLRIISQIMEEVGYMTETLALGHRGEAPAEGDEQSLMQGRKRHKQGGHGRRAGEPDLEDHPPSWGEAPSSSSNVPTNASTGERNTRHDPVPREEHLTAEDWAIMAAVESCVVWRTLKAINMKHREQLLAAICMTLQEMVEGNPQRSTVGCPDDFGDWGRRWGIDDEAKPVGQPLAPHHGDHCSYGSLEPRRLLLVFRT